jgi:hypothetical protein
MNLTFFCSSVALLLSTVMHCTQDGSLDDAINHYKQTPSTATGNITEKLLSTCIYCLSLGSNFKNGIAILLV